MSVNAHMRSNHGVITRREARDAGLTNHQIDRHLRVGEWIAIYRGVFRHAAVRPTWRTRAAAAVAVTGAVASHRCAAALWGLELYQRPPIELTVAGSRRQPQLRQVVVHRTTQWGLIDASVRHGIATTGVERTILDCASTVSDDVLERLAESAIRQRLTSWKQIDAAFSVHATKGRGGTARSRRLLQKRLGAPTVPHSDFSRLVAQLLEQAGVPPACLEYRVHDDDGEVLLLGDLVWPERMRILELDGLANHFGRADRERDIRRRAEVRARGWRLLEIGWELYRSNPQQVVELVRRFLTDPPR